MYYLYNTPPTALAFPVTRSHFSVNRCNIFCFSSLALIVSINCTTNTSCLGGGPSAEAPGLESRLRRARLVGRPLVLRVGVCVGLRGLHLDRGERHQPLRQRPLHRLPIRGPHRPHPGNHHRQVDPVSRRAADDEQDVSQRRKRNESKKRETRRDATRHDTTHRSRVQQQ